MPTSFATCCVLSFERPNFISRMLTTMVETAEYPMEIIVHDDGSENIDLRQYLRVLVNTGRISALIENPPGYNQGQGIALNRMFNMAKGDYIVKLDQDLIFKPGWLRKSVEILETNAANADTEPSIGTLGLFRYPADPVMESKMFRQYWGEAGEHPWEEHEDFVGSAMVMHRDAWETFGPFEERSAAFAEDKSFKETLQREGGLKLALPYKEDLALNQGFGLGPSTVVVQDQNGELTSRDIKDGPFLVDPGSASSVIGRSL